MNCGQAVNKLNSAVRITHIPTNIVIECQDSRSQGKNREQAKRRLIERLQEQAEGAALEAANQNRNQAFDKTLSGEWKWTAWSDRVITSSGQKASMKRVLKRGIPDKLLAN